MYINLAIDNDPEPGISSLYIISYIIIMEKTLKIIHSVKIFISKLTC